MNDSDQQAALQEWYKQQCENFQTTSYLEGRANLGNNVENATTSPNPKSESNVSSSYSTIVKPISSSKNTESRPPGRMIWTQEEDEILREAVAVHGKCSMQWIWISMKCIITNSLDSTI